MAMLDPAWSRRCGAEAVAIGAAGFGAGTINTVVGSGTLLTFPVLLAFGYAPVTANVSNTVGLVAGGVHRAITATGPSSPASAPRAVRLGVLSVARSG